MELKGSPPDVNFFFVYDQFTYVSIQVIFCFKEMLFQWPQKNNVKGKARAAADTSRDVTNQLELCCGHWDRNGLSKYNDRMNTTITVVEEVFRSYSVNTNTTQ